jgi:hypothetical protein
LPLRFVRGGCGIAVMAILLSSRAHANDRASGDAEFRATSQNSAMTRAQLDAFLALVDEPEDEVSRRLQFDQDLTRAAALAADERMNRKRSGTLRSAVGFGILGVGGHLRRAALVVCVLAGGGRIRHERRSHPPRLCRWLHGRCRARCRDLGCHRLASTERGRESGAGAIPTSVCASATVSGAARAHPARAAAVAVLLTG